LQAVHPRTVIAEAVPDGSVARTPSRSSWRTAEIAFVTNSPGWSALGLVPESSSVTRPSAPSGRVVMRYPVVMRSARLLLT